jgi:hypothetical protein
LLCKLVGHGSIIAGLPEVSLQQIPRSGIVIGHIDITIKSDIIQSDFVV